jgi:hypothetical protein
VVPRGPVDQLAPAVAVVLRGNSITFLTSAVVLVVSHQIAPADRPALVVAMLVVVLPVVPRMIS